MEQVHLNCFLPAVQNDGRYCILQKLESLVNLRSDLTSYNANNPILGLGCWTWSPERGHSYSLCKPYGFHFPPSCVLSLNNLVVEHLPLGLGDGMLYCPLPTQSMWPPLASSPVCGIQG